ncbi:hypothetical protein [Streptomyces sp. NPDC088766]|uniref:hypothetical protein n=1 Tax=Streptomyces sp. NPDC088766 TaxID=3365893 RepID=UPI0037F15F93
MHSWVVEQSFALLHRFRRLRNPPGDPRRHPEAFLGLARGIICRRRLVGLPLCQEI